MELKPSKPFANGTEYEFFLENFCYRCKKHKVDKYGFCAFVEDGGCIIENAMEDARYGYDFPNEDIVQLEENGKVEYWHICKSFDSDDAELMEAYKRLLGGGADNGKNQTI